MITTQLRTAEGRVALFSTLAGLASFVVAIVFAQLQWDRLAGLTGGTMVGLTILVAILVPLNAEVAALPKPAAARLGSKLGFRSGILCAALTAGFGVFGSQLMGGASMLKMVPSWAAMGLCPSIGFILGMISGFAEGRVETSPPEQRANRGLSIGKGALSWLIDGGLILLGLAAFFSPFWIPLVMFLTKPSAPTSTPSAVEKSTPEVKAIKPDVSIERPQAAPVPAPPPPPWRYEASSEFSSLPPWSMDVLRSESLPEFAHSMPLAISDDGRFLVCCAGADAWNSTTLRIIDLDIRTESPLTTVSGKVTSLAFAPGSKRLIAISIDPTMIEVISIEGTDRRPMRLPRPVGSQIPTGAAVWWQENEVLFFPQSAEPTKVLLLDSLKLISLDKETSPQWKGLPDIEKRLAEKGVPPLKPLGLSPIRLEALVERIRAPYDQQNAPWAVETQLSPALVSSSSAYRRLLPEIKALSHDRFLRTHDGTKLIRIPDNSNERAVIYYFSKREPPPLKLLAKSPISSVQSADLSEVQVAIKERRLCAFVCQSLVNPLNQKVIGPERTQVKALARVASWEGEQMTLWVAEEFAKVSTGDVICDLHGWKNNLSPIGPSKESEWFCELSSLLPADSSFPLPLTEVPMHERDANPDLSFQGGAFILGDAKPRQETAAVPEPQRQKPPAPVAPQQPALERAKDAIRAFVTAHHKMASDGDIRALVADYAEKCTYFDDGLITPEAIFAKEQDYHRKFSSVAETILSIASIKPSARGAIVIYELRSELISLTGQKRIITSLVTMEIIPFGGTFRILSQKAEVTNTN